MDWLRPRTSLPAAKAWRAVSLLGTALSAPGDSRSRRPRGRAVGIGEVQARPVDVEQPRRLARQGAPQGRRIGGGDERGKQAQRPGGGVGTGIAASRRPGPVAFD
ncbi:MAG: hypothetical protein ACXW3P_08405 [Rhodospirillales bacterium]